MSVYVIEKTRVVRKKTGKVLGFCDVKYVGGYYLERSLVSRGPFFMPPISQHGMFKRIHALRYRWKLSLERSPEIIAHGYRDAGWLRGFCKAEEGTDSECQPTP